jgi:hypothetical protein
MESPCKGQAPRVATVLTSVFTREPATASAFGKPAPPAWAARRKRPIAALHAAPIAKSRSRAIIAAKTGGAASNIAPAVVATSQSTVQPAGATPAPKLISKTSKAPTPLSCGEG